MILGLLRFVQIESFSKVFFCLFVFVFVTLASPYLPHGHLKALALGRGGGTVLVPSIHHTTLYVLPKFRPLPRARDPADLPIFCPCV